MSIAQTTTMETPEKLATDRAPMNTDKSNSIRVYRYGRCPIGGKMYLSTPSQFRSPSLLGCKRCLGDIRGRTVAIAIPVATVVAHDRDALLGDVSDGMEEARAV